MTDPRRLSDSDTELGKALQSAMKLECAPEEERATGDALKKRLAFERGRWSPAWRWALAGAAALILTFIGVRTWRGFQQAPALVENPLPTSSPGQHIIAGVGQFDYEPSAKVSFDDRSTERRITVRRGLFKARVDKQEPTRPVVVATPHLEITVLGTRFDVRVEAGETHVELFEGAIRVASPWRTIELKGASAIASTDERLTKSAEEPEPALPDAPLEAPAPLPRKIRPLVPTLAPASPEPSPAPKSEPSGAVGECQLLESTQERLDCLKKLSVGGGAVAEAALYNLGLLQRGSSGAGGLVALATFADLERRFPKSLLAPEAAMRRVELLKQRGDLAGAIAAAKEFERYFPGEPRRFQGMLVRAELLCESSKNAPELEALLEELRAHGDTATKRATEKLRGSCGAR